MNRSPCFADLEGPEDRNYWDSTPSEATQGWEEWYRSIRRTPFDQIGDGDLAKALRQGWNLAELLPVVVERIIEHPMRGVLYDGELLSALAHLDEKYFQTVNQSLLSLKQAMPVILVEAQNRDGRYDDGMNFEASLLNAKLTATSDGST